MKTTIDNANRSLFITAIEVRSGEEQYITYRLVPDALDEREAEERVLAYFRSFLDRVSPESPQCFEDPKGYPHYSLEFVTPVRSLRDIYSVIPRIGSGMNP
jgi:hypothetical protein